MSTLRCKPGDIAIISKVTRENQHLDKIVTIIKLFDDDSWICDPELISCDGTLLSWPDYALTPIRDQPGQDETLQWCDVPSKETAM